MIPIFTLDFGGVDLLEFTWQKKSNKLRFFLATLVPVSQIPQKSPQKIPWTECALVYRLLKPGSLALEWPKIDTATKTEDNRRSKLDF